MSTEMYDLLTETPSQRAHRKYVENYDGVFRDGWSNENPTKKGAPRDMSAEFQMVPLDVLDPSSTNPRRHFTGMQELTESVRQHGVLTPLLVRPRVFGDRQRFEIIAGERRYRAAQKAEVAEVPIRCKEMTDEQALELQIIENLQRQDVHPLDEALGFERLHEMGQSTEQIADKVNKSASYVYQRMKLTALIPKLQEAFLADKLTAGHAVQLARLNPKHQAEILKDNRLEDTSVRDLGEVIQERYHLQLSRAAFPIDDATLPGGSCKVCLKRTGANPGLFPDVKAKDTCTDPLCFKEKSQAFVKLQLEKEPEAIAVVVRPSSEPRPKKEVDWTPSNGRQCEDTGLAVVTEITDRHAGEDRKLKLGQKLEVCVNPNCKVHHPKPEKSDYNPRTGNSRAADKKSKLETKRQLAIFQAFMLRDLEEPNKNELQGMLGHALENLSSDCARLICQAMGWEVKPDRYKQRNFQGAVEAKLKDHKQPLAILHALDIASSMWLYGGSNNDAKNARQLEAAATRRGVNVAAIGKEVEAAAEKKPKAKAEDKPKAEAKPPKAKKTAKAKKAKKKAA